MENKLRVIIKEQDVETSGAKMLVEAFGGPFEEVGQVLATYKQIEVTQVGQLLEMAKAREQRLILKKARTTVENKRKELKADIVKQGRAIDSVARFVREEIQPAEEYLELQGKFAEIKKAEKAAEIRQERLNSLSKLTDNTDLYDLDRMTVEQFTGLLADLKAKNLAEEQRLTDEAKAQEVAAQAERDEQERVLQENIKLRAEAEQREKDAAIEREKLAKAQALADEKAAAERAKINAENEKNLAAERAKADDERKKREELEQAQRDKEAAEVKAKADQDATELANLLAPDKQKLLNFAAAMEIVRFEKLPAVKTARAQDIVNMINKTLRDMQDTINKEIELL